MKKAYVFKSKESKRDVHATTVTASFFKIVINRSSARRMCILRNWFDIFI
jgi:hypothetical protein